jgi:hypothetical protein
MEIDLNDIPIGISESQRELTILKSAKMYREIKKSKDNFTVITVSMPVYNVLSCHEYFSPSSIASVESLVEVGWICGCKVLLDLTLQENLIQLSYDNQEKRDSILSNLLENTKIKKDLIIKVLNC